MNITPYDLAYRTLLTLCAPALWLKPRLRRKLAKARRERDGNVPPRDGAGPCVLIHAVSLGEVNATRELVRLLLDSEESLACVVSSTTDTGFARATQLFGGNKRVSVVRFPLDLSDYVRRFLDNLRPTVAVLMELEVWPNFVAECGRRGVPVVLVNGRITDKSFRKYRRVRPLVRPMFAGLSAVCVQEDAYADRFAALGVPRERISVTGTMKFDAATVGDRVEGDAALAADLGLKPRSFGGGEPIVICGSTGPGEEEVLLAAYEQLRILHPSLRLVIVPRKPERFDEVARWIVEERDYHVVRRSRPSELQRTAATRVHGIHPDDAAAIRQSAVILGDTMGELRKFYSLADIVIVGRTLVDLGEKQHGSDMIEPAALGKPVVVGPFTGNFAEPMRALREAGAIAEVAAPDPDWAASVEPIVEQIDRWLRDPAAAAEVGRRAREVVVANQGATAKHVEAIRLATPRRGVSPVSGRGRDFPNIPTPRR